MVGTYVKQASLLNSYSAADVDTTSRPGWVLIKGLEPFHALDFAGAEVKNSVAEVAQIATIGAVTVPTIVAGAKYQIMLGHTGTRREGAQVQMKQYGYTAPAVLTSATIDRHNAYYSIAQKINADRSSNATAYAMVTLTHAAGTFAVGDTLIGATSGAQGIVLASSSGSATVGMLTPAMFVVENVDDVTGSVGPLAVSAVTAGVGLRIIDDGNYYRNRNERGVNTILATKGFTQAMVVINTAGVYAHGIGTRMLEDIPVLEKTTGNLASGEWGMPLNNAPVAGATYRLIVIRSKPNVNHQALSDNTGRRELIQHLWLNEGDGDLAATTTAITSITANVAP